MARKAKPKCLFWDCDKVPPITALRSIVELTENGYRMATDCPCEWCGLVRVIARLTDLEPLPDDESRFDLVGATVRVPCGGPGDYVEGVVTDADGECVRLWLSKRVLNGEDCKLPKHPKGWYTADGCEVITPAPDPIGDDQ